MLAAICEVKFRTSPAARGVEWSVMLPITESAAPDNVDS